MTKEKPHTFQYGCIYRRRKDKNNEACTIGIYAESTLSSKIRTEQITHKLSAACYAMRSVKPFMSQETLKMVYCAHFTVINYELIFFGYCSRSANVVKIQNNIIRIITGCRLVETHVQIYLRI
jgi:hypothetical protein